MVKTEIIERTSNQVTVRCAFCNGKGVVIASKAKQSHEKGNKRIRRETCKMTR